MEMTRVVVAFLLMFYLMILPSWAFLFPLPSLFKPQWLWRGEEPQPFDPRNGSPTQEDEDQNKLQVDFYRNSCPQAEKIVATAVNKIFQQTPGALAALVRLHFHDCFIGGCDASVLLDSTPSEEKVEKGSLANGEFLKGADIIDDIKVKLEKECPETVSCADALAFASRDALVLAGIQKYTLLGGRRDSLASLAKDADNLPFPNWTADQLLTLFEKKGFGAEDLAVLSGAHSLGSAHCSFFSDRLYNYSNQIGKADPSLNSDFLAELKGICLFPDPNKMPPNTPVNFDETPTKLDNLYFKNLVQKKSLLSTDEAIASDPRTAPFVQKFADDAQDFTNKFRKAIIRMGSLDVITGNVGEVRKICRSTN